MIALRKCNVLTLDWWQAKGRHQNSLPLTTHFSQNVTEQSKGISYPVGDLCRRFTKLTGPFYCSNTVNVDMYTSKITFILA